MLENPMISFCIILVCSSLLACSNGAKRTNIQNVTDSPTKNELVQKVVECDYTQELQEEKEDSAKIYEQSELDEKAIPAFTNAQILKLLSEHFKYPDIEPMNGRGECDLIIEKDGRISDVIIVKGIHPKLDAEFIRVLKMLPKFIPGKKDNKPVRSKYRHPITAKIM